MRKQTMSLMTLFATLLSSACMVSCVNPPKKPVGSFGAVNAKSKAPYRLDFNLETDFSEDLKLRDGVQGVRVPIILDDLHKHWCMNTSTKEELVRYALQWKERYLLLQKQLNECRNQ